MSDSNSTASAEGLQEDFTQLLAAWRLGGDTALADAMPLIYDQLRRLAGRHLNREDGGHSLDTRDLVHEAFLRLEKQRQVHWQSRAHFLAIAGRMMRRLLIDHARKKFGRARDRVKVELDEQALQAAHRGVDLLAVDQALVALHAEDPELAQIVELRFFGGMRHQEIAEVIGKSEPTVRRRFRLAKAWLHTRLRQDAEPPKA